MSSGYNAKVITLRSLLIDEPFLVVGNADGKFSIDPNTGRIYAQRLDRELQERYTLTVRARDNGTPSKQNDTTVIITVS